MNTYDFVHLAFSALGNEIRGKTKLQKSVYFLGLLSGHDDELGYRAHYYGPYSDEVASAVERLRTMGFLDESMSSGGAVDSRGFEVARCDYRLNEIGKEVATTKAKSFPEVWSKLTEAANRLNRLLSQDYMNLSIAAKAYYLLKGIGGKATMKDLEKLAPRFGWDVNEKQLHDAARLLNEVKLVNLR